MFLNCSLAASERCDLLSNRTSSRQQSSPGWPESCPMRPAPPDFLSSKSSLQSFEDPRGSAYVASLGLSSALQQASGQKPLATHYAFRSNISQYDTSSSRRTGTYLDHASRPVILGWTRFSVDSTPDSKELKVCSSNPGQEPHSRRSRLAGQKNRDAPSRQKVTLYLVIQQVVNDAKTNQAEPAVQIGCHLRSANITQSIAGTSTPSVRQRALVISAHL